MFGNQRGQATLPDHELISRFSDSDVTRLLDRLEQQYLIKRERHGQDRRVVLTFITGKGLGLLKQLDLPMRQLHQRQLGHLGKESLLSLVDLLQLARVKTG
jgi:DNA-binding MarR family transcriptional regulator